MKNSVAGICFVSVMTAAGMSGQTGEAKKPNVVFLLVDDLWWADLGLTGSTS